MPNNRVLAIIHSYDKNYMVEMHWLKLFTKYYMNKSLQKLYFHFSKNIMHFTYSICAYVCEREKRREGGRQEEKERKKY